MSRPAAQPSFSRVALAPGILAAIVLVGALPLIGTEWYLYVRYTVSILALILCVFAGQARQWWWLAALVPIAVIWNPVWPIAFPDLLLRLLHLAAAVLFVAVAIRVKVPVDPRR